MDDVATLHQADSGTPVGQSEPTQGAEPQSPQQTSTPSWTTDRIKWQGEEKELSRDEILNLAQQGYDYTQKRQMDAALRKEYEQKVAEVSMREQTVAQQEQQLREYAESLAQYVQAQQAQAHQPAQPQMQTYYDADGNPVQVPVPQQLPQTPQWQPPPQPQRNPLEDRLNQLDMRQQMYDLNHEMERGYQQFPALRDNPFAQSVLLQQVIATNGTVPTVELMRRLNQQVAEYDDGVMKRAREAEAKARATQQPLAGGIPQLNVADIPLDQLGAHLKRQLASVM